MRGWQPSIAMTRVVPERSAPIMMMGRSFSVIGISFLYLFLVQAAGRSGLLDVQISQPGEEVEIGLARSVLEGGGHADLLEYRLPAFGGVQGDERSAQALDLGGRNLRRRDQRHVDLVAASSDDPAAVPLPA